MLTPDIVKSIDLDIWQPEQMEVGFRMDYRRQPVLTRCDRRSRNGETKGPTYTGNVTSKRATSHLISQSRRFVDTSFSLCVGWVNADTM